MERRRVAKSPMTWHAQRERQLNLRFAQVCMLFIGLFGGCAIELVPPYDEVAVKRIEQMSHCVLNLYQDILLLPTSERRMWVEREVRSRASACEVTMRVHILQLKARPLSNDHVALSQNLLTPWQNFVQSMQSPAEDALTDANLEIQRELMARHLQAAFASEQAGRLANVVSE